MNFLKHILSRETAKGLLVIAHDCGELSATLGGNVHAANVQTLAQPIAHALGRITHTIGGCVALFDADVAAIETATGLFLRRCEMVRACHSGGAFPGSKEWKRAQAAEKALVAFDAAHPDIVAAIAEKNARKQAEVATMAD